MCRHVRISIRWPRALRRGVAVTLSGVVISIVSMLGEPATNATGGRTVIEIELRRVDDTTDNLDDGALTRDR